MRAGPGAGGSVEPRGSPGPGCGAEAALGAVARALVRVPLAGGGRRWAGRCQLLIPLLFLTAGSDFAGRCRGRRGQRSRPYGPRCSGRWRPGR